MDPDKLFVYRIIPIANLEDNLQNGLYCKNKSPQNQNFKTLGNEEIIAQRAITKVKCYPKSVVNDFVPFYFSIRTPMLYNIYTEKNVSYYPQKDIIYLCFKFCDLITNKFKWCYTDGNAANAITKFYKNLDDFENRIDWRSVQTTDFRNANADDDNDRVRKKHSELLVKGFVPSKLINRIVVIDDEKKKEVEIILKNNNLDISILISAPNEYYFKCTM